MSGSFTNLLYKYNSLQSQLFNLQATTAQVDGDNIFTGSNAFTEIPTTATAPAGDISSNVATTEFVQTAISNIPDILVLDNTFLGDNQFQKIPTTDTAPQLDSSSKVATTSYVDTAVSNLFTTDLVFNGQVDFSQTPTTETMAPLTNSIFIATTAYVDTAISVIPDLLSLNNTFTGTNDFTNQISFNLPPHSISPLLGNDVATKGYVDSLVGQYSGGLNLFLNYSQPVTVGGINYFSLSKQVSAAPQQSIVTPTNGGEHLLVSFISNELNILEIPAGLFDLFLYGAVSSPNQIVYYHFHLKKYSGGDITSISISGNSKDVNASPSSNPEVYLMNATISSPVPMLLTDRIIIEIYYDKTGGTAVDLTTYFENAYYSFVQSTLNAGTTLLTSNNNWTGTNTFALSPTVPTVSAGDASTKAASTEFVNTAVSNIVAIVAPSNSTTLNVVNKVIVQDSTSEQTIILDASGNPSISAIFNNLTGEINTLNLKSLGTGIFINSQCTVGLRPILYSHNGAEYMRAYVASNNGYLEVGANGGVKFLTFGGASTVINANDALSFSLPSNTTAHTKTANNNSSQVATTAYVDSAVTNAPFVGTATSNLNMNNNSINNTPSIDSSSALTLGGTTALGVNIGRTGQTTNLIGDSINLTSTNTNIGPLNTVAGFVDIGNPLSQNVLYGKTYVGVNQTPIGFNSTFGTMFSTAVNSAYMLFNSGTNWISGGDSSITATGGNGTINGGNLAIQASNIDLLGNVTASTITTPTTTGTLTIGADQIVGGTVTIGSSTSNTRINGLIKTPAITSISTTGALTIGAEQIAGGTVTIGSSTSSTRINGIIKMPNLSTNNYVFRKATGTQSIPNNTSTTVFFATLTPPANTVGLNYTDVDGRFTNSNASTITCQITYTVAYPANASGVRNAQVFSSTLNALGISEINVTANVPTILSSSAIVTVPQNGYFIVTCFQNSGVALTLNNRTCIQILVL